MYVVLLVYSCDDFLFLYYFVQWVEDCLQYVLNGKFFSFLRFFYNLIVIYSLMKLIVFLMWLFLYKE